MTTSILISHDDMAAKLRAVKGATIISLIAETVPKLKKTGNNLGEVKKVAYVNGMLNFSYGNSVNKQRKREGKATDFVPQNRKWGESKGAVVEKTLKSGETQVYLNFKLERIVSEKYVGIGGGVLSDAVVEAFLTGKKKSTRQDLTKNVIMLNYKLSNIRQIKMNGKTYIIA